LPQVIKPQTQYVQRLKVEKSTVLTALDGIASTPFTPNLLASNTIAVRATWSGWYITASV